MDKAIIASVTAAALGCRCPACGVGPLFDGFLKVKARCDICGINLTDHDSGDGPAVFLIFVIGFIVPPLAIITELAYAPPVWLHVLLWPALILILTLLTISPAKALTVALQYHTRSSVMKGDDDEGA